MCIRDRAKAQSAVEIKDNSRNTWIRYDNKGKQQGWIARAELTLESKDSQALSTLVHELDGVLAIDRVSASVSREKLSSLENELTKEALAKVKDKALLIQESLQMKGYHTQSLDVSSCLLYTSIGVKRRHFPANHKVPLH